MTTTDPESYCGQKEVQRPVSRIPSLPASELKFLAPCRSTRRSTCHDAVLFFELCQTEAALIQHDLRQADVPLRRHGHRPHLRDLLCVQGLRSTRGIQSYVRAGVVIDDMDISTVTQKSNERVQQF